MAKTRPGSRLYAQLHTDMGKWGVDAMPQSTVAWVCCKKNGQKNIYQFEKWQYIN